MQLKLYFPASGEDWQDSDEEVTVRTESDIRTAGFAAARAVREWLRRMPFVPSQADLHWGISAEVVPDEKAKPAPAAASGEPAPKRKKKASK